MFSLSSRIRGWLLVGWLLVASVLPGCSNDGEKQTDPNAKRDPATGENALEKLNLQEVIDAYAVAEGYSDQARVVLRYTLNGVPIEESHPFSTRLFRKRIHRAEWFKLRLEGDESSLIGRVVDLPTGNFGGQVLCLEKGFHQGLATLFRDPIAAHYLSGQDDIPWETATSETKERRTAAEIAAQVTELLGIARQLFRGGKSKWLNSENLEQSRRVATEDHVFFDTVFDSPWGKISCRIDPAQKLVLGFRLPPKLLDRRISASPEVKDISFVMLFENAGFRAADAKNPTLRILPNEKPVRKFVKLPESFPSEAVGKPVDDWNLIDEKGRRFRKESILRRPALFLFGDPTLLTPTETSRIEDLVQNSADTNLAWILPQSIPISTVKLPFSRMGLFADQNNDVLKFFQPEQTTFLFLTGPGGTVQYVSMYGKDWLRDVDGTLQRLRKGDDVAREMHAQYAKYFADYERKLQQQAASPALLQRLKQSSN